MPFSGCQRLMLSPKKRMIPSRLQFFNRGAELGFVGPGVVPDMKLQHVDGVDAKLLADQVGILENVLGGEDVAVLVFGQRRPAVVCRRNLRRRIEPLAGVALHDLAQQAHRSCPRRRPMRCQRSCSPGRRPTACAARDSLSSDPLHPLMPQSPWAMSLTSNPVRPSLRYFIMASFEKVLVNRLRLCELRQHISKPRRLALGRVLTFRFWPRFRCSDFSIGLIKIIVSARPASGCLMKLDHTEERSLSHEI